MTENPRVQSNDTDNCESLVPLESILCTDELKSRPSRLPDYEEESRALVTLAKALADSPRTVLQTLADMILDVCRAGSAGVSLLTKEDGGKRFYWPAISGQWKQHIGGGTPRNFGPCGDVLDRNTPLLMRQVHRRYAYFDPVQPAVQEALLVPFYVQDIAVGTIWAVSHDERKFDAEDERLMKSLGQFASSAYQTLESLDALTLQASDALKGESASALLAAIVDSSDDAIISKTLDGIITSWNKSAERLFGHTPEESIGKHITLIVPLDRCQEEVEILQRLKRGERIEHFETVRVRKDGTSLDISLTISPVKDGSGRVIGASKVARDITDKKRVERALRESEEMLRSLADNLETQVGFRTRELQVRNTEILGQAEQLRELSQRLLQSQDEERRRIARDLHDSAGQIVTALGMHLAVISQGAMKPEIRQAAEECQEMLKQFSKEIRTVSYLLHPPLLDENGLPEAIRWYMKGLTERSGLKISLDIPDDFGRLTNDLEVAIFRIVQEGLTNIHRHSKGTKAMIGLTHKGSEVRLEIQDNGTGIPKDTLTKIQTRRSGVGMTGMQERVRHLGGNLDIESDTNGTKISVTLPLVTNPAVQTEAGKADAAG